MKWVQKEVSTALNQTKSFTPVLNVDIQMGFMSHFRKVEKAIRNGKLFSSVRVVTRDTD